MIHLTYPYIPPSINRSYGTNKYGTFYQKTIAKVYKEEFVSFAKEHWLNIINSTSFKHEDIFHLTVHFYFNKEDLFNDKFGKDKRIESPYKRLDLDNRRKVLQDSLCAVFGIDDSKIFSSSDAKFISEEKRIEIYLEKVSLEDYSV